MKKTAADHRTNNRRRSMNWIGTRKPSTTRRFAAVMAPPQPAAVDVTPEESVIPADLLDGGEVVIFAIKPSLWFSLLSPMKWIVSLALVMALLPLIPTESLIGITPQSLIQGLVCVLGLRLLIALMQWGSQFYVLTNRRVMTMRGIFQAEIWSCPINRVRECHLEESAPESIVGLGSIEFVTSDEPDNPRYWRYVCNSEDIYAEIRKAMTRSHD